MNRLDWIEVGRSEMDHDCCLLLNLAYAAVEMEKAAEQIDFGIAVKDTEVIDAGFIWHDEAMAKIRDYVKILREA